MAINGQAIDEGVIVAFRGTAALLPESFLRSARLSYDPGELVPIEGQGYLPLTALQGSFVMETARQQLQVTLPPAAFLPTHLNAEPPRPAFSPVRPTVQLNYDLALDHSGGQTVAGALLEVGAAGVWGSVTSRVVVGHGRRAVLLDTAYVRDDPARGLRLSLGDALSSGSGWTAPVRFTGVRFGTDFSLRPGYQTLAAPTIRGEAALPSDVALYVNSVLSAQGHVDQGPFVFDRTPFVTGAGQIALRTTDLLGIERTTVTDYYASSSLLRPGLTDSSLEVGVERLGFGQSSFSYGAAFASGSYRRGLSPALTVEAHAEVSPAVQGVGGGLAATLGGFAEAGGALAVSHAAGRAGVLAQVSAGHVGPRWSLTATYQTRSSAYRQIGLAAPPRQLVQLGASIALRGIADLSLTAVRLDDGGNTTQIATMGFSRRLGGRTNLTAFAMASRPQGARARVSFGLSLVHTFGGGVTASLRGDDYGRAIAVQRSAPLDRGWGYRLIAADGGEDWQQAEVSLRAAAVDASVNAVHLPGSTALRGLASGGLLFADGAILAARRFDGATAIVNVGPHPGIRVMQDNRVVGRTNRRGIAVLTGLRPFEENRVGLMAEDFDIATRVGTDLITLVPGARSVVDARFAVASGASATVIIADPEGTLIEPGTPVMIDGETVWAGYGGMVFVDNARAGQVLEAQIGRGRSCVITLPALAAEINMPEIGPVRCRLSQ